MESSDILDDKDSGPEVQINIPSSVMSRIEELMGGTEQFDSEEVCSHFTLFYVIMGCSWQYLLRYDIKIQLEYLLDV